jgi:hypothetical protein
VKQQLVAKEGRLGHKKSIGAKKKKYPKNQSNTLLSH